MWDHSEWRVKRRYLLGYTDGVDEVGVESVAQFLDTGGDLVEEHRLLLPITLDDEHAHVVFLSLLGLPFANKPSVAVAGKE